MILEAIKELNDDDRAFMIKLYHKYYALIRKTIYHMTYCNKYIDDLINDAFVKLIEKVSLLCQLDSCKISSYIFYTAKSVSINYIKHKSVENKHMYYCKDAVMKTI